MNLDIFLDDTSTDWQLLHKFNPEVVMCLARTEFDAKTNGSYRDPLLMQTAFSNSQDAWIFRAPIKVANCEFEIGTLGCDNAIAHRIKQSGYVPLNAPNRFKIFHLDRCRGKTMDNQVEIYQRERTAEKGKGVNPDREGHYLLPDIDIITSVDQLIAQMKLTDADRYAIICDVMSKYLQINNSGQ